MAFPPPPKEKFTPLGMLPLIQNNPDAALAFVYFCPFPASSLDFLLLLLLWLGFACFDRTMLASGVKVGFECTHQ